ncbi:hypothetical protein E2C01_036973 [Portunus trituberculatus]|uniref:Uncharacterized protein n=1 Tax=Portunus trituberculatus TaxID=210409 RepID=A0A5B7F6W0_PORTR|nr:hypothetical protein [Portunus trituberculatus]
MFPKGLQFLENLGLALVGSHSNLRLDPLLKLPDGLLMSQTHLLSIVLLPGCGSVKMCMSFCSISSAVMLLGRGEVLGGVGLSAEGSARITS